MNKIFLDTNILIYILQGKASVRDLVEDKIWFTCFINEMELLMRPDIRKNENIAIHNLLADCNIIEMTQFIKAQAIQNAQKYRLKLADSIILSAAQAQGIPLLTADLEFKKAASDKHEIVILSF